MINRTRLIPAAVCAVLALALGLVVWRTMSGPSPQAASHGSGAALVGGPFKLVDQNGKAVDQAVLKGKWTAVFFGFTYCPDVCPTTLAAMGQAQTLLGPKAKDLQVIFVSLDPERDTPAQMANYLSNDAFPKGTIGLTGTPAQVAKAAKAYRVFYEKSGTGSDYLINHSTASYVMDPKGRFARVLPFGIDPDEIAKQISGAMAK